jgi:hypothetical protein
MKLIETILKTIQHYIGIGLDAITENVKPITIGISIYWLLLQAYRLANGQECATLFEILMIGMILNLYKEYKSK